MSSRNIYPLACHSLNEEAVLAEQGKQAVRKSNSSSSSQQAEGLVKGCRESGIPQAQHLLLKAAASGKDYC